MHDSHYEIFFFIDTNFPHAYNVHRPYYYFIYNYCFHIIILHSLLMVDRDIPWTES